MRALEERVSFIEAKVEEHARALGDLRGLIVALDEKIDRRFDVLDQRMTRLFQWVIGIQFSILATIVAGLLTLIGALLRR